MNKRQLIVEMQMEAKRFAKSLQETDAFQTTGEIFLATDNPLDALDQAEKMRMPTSLNNSIRRASQLLNVQDRDFRLCLCFFGMLIKSMQEEGQEDEQRTREVHC